MKLDEIIEELERIRGKITDYPSTFVHLVIELAHHVKAQEPEMFTKADLDFLLEEEKKHGSKE